MPYGINEVNYALKRIYPRFPPANTASWAHPFMSHTKQEDIWTGEENMKQGVEYGNPQGIGGDFAKAQAVSSSTIGDYFDVPRRWKYGFAKIDGKAIVATSNSEGAFFKAVKRETDNGIRAFGDRLATELMIGDGNGWIGRVSAINALDVTLGPSAGVLTKWAARRFKQQMSLEASTDGTLGNVRANFNTTGTATVLKVNYKTGIVSLSGLANLIVGDYLAAAGDFGTGCHGVGFWIPLADPGSADSTFGVNRSKNPTMLSGHRLQAAATAASNSIKENAMDLAAEMATTGSLSLGKKDGYLSPLNWNRLQKDLDAQVKREPGDGKFAFPYIEQETAVGTVEWFSDSDMEDDRGYILTRETWVVRDAYGFPHLNEDDGNAALRAASADQIEVRLRSAGNLFCLAPSGNGVFPITPPA